MNDIIVGLSGHIDHGKSAFVRAINGFDGDERSDEKARGITIDLSFSNVLLGGNNIAFIDVPGHEKLVKNMIAGAFGVDVLALIVAADDGVMPQSIEHLHIARLLGIKKILVFITKCDLVAPAKIEAVKAEIEALLAELNLAALGIYPFSIHQKDSIENAKKILANLSKRESRFGGESRLESGRESGEFFRYYCDRVFSKKGLGTIVTGTILGGEVRRGEKVFICDLNKEVALKTIHNHEREVESAHASQRIAFNISLPQGDLQKGMLLSKKGILRGFDKVDCVIYPLTNIANNQSVSFFIGARRLTASVNLLETIDLDSANPDAKNAAKAPPNPHATAKNAAKNATKTAAKNPQTKRAILATLKLDSPIFAVFKERFILRDNAATIGGGEILNPITDPMKKAQKLQYLRFLHEDNLLGAFKILIDAHKCGFGLIQSLQRFGIPYAAALDIARKIKGVFVDESALVVYSLAVQSEIREAILRLIEKNKNSIFSASSINHQLKWSSLDFTQSVIEELELTGQVKRGEQNLFLSTKSDIKDIFAYAKEAIVTELERGGFTPEAPYNIYEKLSIERKLGDEVFKSLTKSKKVVRLSHNLFVLSAKLNAIMEALRGIIKAEGGVDIAAFKRHFDISRKYIICYLDYLDSFGDIEKVENKRVLKSQK